MGFNEIFYIIIGVILILLFLMTFVFKTDWKGIVRTWIPEKKTTQGNEFSEISGEDEMVDGCDPIQVHPAYVNPSGKTSQCPFFIAGNIKNSWGIYNSSGNLIGELQQNSSNSEYYSFCSLIRYKLGVVEKNSVFLSGAKVFNTLNSAGFQLLATSSIIFDGNSIRCSLEEVDVKRLKNPSSPSPNTNLPAVDVVDGDDKITIVDIQNDKVKIIREPFGENYYIHDSRGMSVYYFKNDNFRFDFVDGMEIELYNPDDKIICILKVGVIMQLSDCPVFLIQDSSVKYFILNSYGFMFFKSLEEYEKALKDAKLPDNIDLGKIN